MTTFNTRLIRSAALFVASLTLLACGTDYEFRHLYEDLPFEMAKVQRPDIPVRQVNIEDFGGNISKKINHTFLYYNAKEYDIVINEIMADPSPPIELPEYEYIELYNTTDFPININNWKLTVGNTELPIDKNTTIQGNDYLILCHNDAVEKLSEFGNCLSFSSFQITNSGTTLSLIDRNNHLVSSVEFKSSWHSSSYKQ